MNRQLFFEAINQSLFGGRLSARQKAGMEVKLDAFEAYEVPDPRWTAYMLATSYYETAATMQPIEEYGKGKDQPYGRKQKRDGSVYTCPHRIYYGRGDVQLTWYENYQQMGEILGIPLLEQPELALQPAISARIMIEGMTRGCSGRGDFTGVSLEDYFNGYRDDPVNARRVVNGLDSAQRIAGYYRKFLTAIKVALMVVVMLVAGCMPSKTVTQRGGAQTDRSAVSVTADSLWRTESMAALLAKEVKRTRGERLAFRSEARIRDIYYDTTAPLDSASGRYPVAREVVATIGSRYGRQVEEEATGSAGAKIIRQAESHESRAQHVDVKVKTKQDEVLKENIELPRPQFSLLVIGVVLGLIIALIVSKSTNEKRVK